MSVFPVSARAAETEPSGGDDCEQQTRHRPCQQIVDFCRDGLTKRQEILLAHRFHDRPTPAPVYDIG